MCVCEDKELHDGLEDKDEDKVEAEEEEEEEHDDSDESTEKIAFCSNRTEVGLTRCSAKPACLDAASSCSVPKPETAMPRMPEQSVRALLMMSRPERPGSGRPASRRGGATRAAKQQQTESKREMRNNKSCERRSNQGIGKSNMNEENQQQNREKRARGQRNKPMSLISNAHAGFASSGGGGGGAPSLAKAQADDNADDEHEEEDDDGPAAARSLVLQRKGNFSHASFTD